MDGTGTVGLNHAVLYVADPAISSAFYCEVLGMNELAALPDMVFLTAPGSPNDHDLGLFRAAGTPGTDRAGTRPGLYHLAWEVATLRALAETRHRLVARDALVGQSDHTLTKSLYAHDPDGIEFEVCWQIPLDAVDRGRSDHVPTQALDLDAEMARFGPDTLGGWLELQERERSRR